jgi:DnaJ-class molecular chaperone
MWGNRRGMPKGPNANSEIQVSLEELYNGSTKEFTIKKNVLCPICRGTGAKDGKLK